MILLKTVNLRKQFGETRACDGLDFVVHKGEFLSLVGSNGAGKTTLVNLISAHLQPDSGQILLEDRDITYTSVAERIQAGIAPGKMILSVAYGGEVTDMLQPFWALPLLAIVGVRARDIVGYTAIVMVFAGAWMLLGLVLF